MINVLPRYLRDWAVWIIQDPCGCAWILRTHEQVLVCRDHASVPKQASLEFEDQISDNGDHDD